MRDGRHVFYPAAATARDVIWAHCQQRCCSCVAHASKGGGAGSSIACPASVYGHEDVSCKALGAMREVDENAMAGERFRGAGRVWLVRESSRIALIAAHCS